MKIEPIKTSATSLFISLSCAGLLINSSVILADAANTSNYAYLQQDMPYLFVVHKGRSVKIVRDISQSFRVPSHISNTLKGNAETCPPFCLQPLKMDDLPVETIAEVGVVDFMVNYLSNNTGVLIDIRNPKHYAARTIPGSVNYYIQTIQKGPGDPDFDAMLKTLGAKPRGEVDWLTRQMENMGLSDTSEVTDSWDFTGAKELIVWGEGQSDNMAPKAIRVLLEAGYPAHKMRWYHGGIASWTFWGFTTYVEPKKY